MELAIKNVPGQSFVGTLFLPDIFNIEISLYIFRLVLLSVYIKNYFNPWAVT